VLSGIEISRAHPSLVRANYLASPPLVVAYALAGRMDLDLTPSRSATDKAGKPVYLRENLAHAAGSGIHRSRRSFHGTIS